MDKKEYVNTVFDEAKNEMRTYFSSMNEESLFNEFELFYDNITYSVQLFVRNLDGHYSELDRWNNFNLTMFKQLISLADQFSKSNDKNFEFWKAVPIKVSMRC